MHEAMPPTSFEPKDDILGTLDYTKPVSALIWASTKRIHDAASQSGLAGRLLQGELSKDEYTYYMMILWRIYNVLEKGLETHSTNPVLASTYRPTLLGRARRISADIAYLLGTTEEGWRSNPLYLSLVSAPPPGVRAYVAYLEKLSDSTDELDHTRLLAHAYVRYMGDLSGGQIIKNKIGKKHELPDIGAGASFYDFGSLQGTSGPGEKRATQSELLKIKEWYRQGMNEGVGDDRALKETIIREAHLAFEYNLRFFEDVFDPNQSTELSDYTPEPKVIFDASQGLQEKLYPVSSVVAVVIALALAHFILVIGGFTGNQGTEKLEGVMLWLREVMGYS